MVLEDQECIADKEERTILLWQKPKNTASRKSVPRFANGFPVYGVISNTWRISCQRVTQQERNLTPVDHLQSV